MTIADLVDLEAQLARDRDAEPAALEARDRGLLRGAGGEGLPRAERLRRWLDAVRAADPGSPRPGGAVAFAVAAVRWALTLGGIAAGWGVATALLAYTGAHPVNVWELLLVFVGVQVALLALVLVSFAFPVATVGAPLLGVFRAAVSAAQRRLASRSVLPGHASEWAAVWHSLRSRRSLYRHVEPWILLATTQAFGVAFNVGALLACARLVVFSDVAFGWSTTLLELDAERFHSIVSGLATPWAALWPDAVPSDALVAATRYSRLEGAYLDAGARRAADPLLVGGWWPFVIAAIACYGLLPRVVTFAVARIRLARLLARLPLDDAEVARVLRRISEPHVETRGTAAPAPEDGAPPAATGREARAAIDAGPGCTLLLWRDVPPAPRLEAAVARQLRCPVVAVRPAEGSPGDGDAAAGAAAAPGSGALVLVAEAFEAPDRAALRFLGDLRRAAGPRRHVVVMLVGAGGDEVAPPSDLDVRIWRERLARLEDPYLAVEPLGDRP